MARLEDYLDQATLDKLRGVQSAPVESSSVLTMPDAQPEMPAATSTPLAGPALPQIAPTKGMGPLSNSADYKPSVLDGPKPASDDDLEAGDDAKNQVLKDVFGKNSHNTDDSTPPVSSPDQGFTNNTVANLQAVQNDANQQKLVANLMGNAALISSGSLGQKNHTAAPDISNQMKMYEGQKKQADEGVAQFQALGEKEKDDPGSSASVNMRAFANELAGKAGLKLNFNDKLSFSDIEKKFPSLAKMYDAKQTADWHRDLMSDKNADRQLAREKKDDEKGDKVLQSTQQLLESARGNPAAAQAEKDLYAASKANSLASLYGDPNKLNPAMTQLLATEVAKIASGGVPTMHELEGLNPATLKSKFAGTWEKLTNHPTPAHAAAFIKQYQDYAGALTKDAQKVIGDKYGRVIESRKDQLGEKNYKHLQDQYLNRFNTPEQGPASKSTGKIKVSNGKETLMIDAADLDHANKDGYKRI